MEVSPYRQARWALYLSRFDFMLKYVPGSRMEKADSLSRRPDWEVGIERDNKNQTLIKPEWLEARRIETVEIIVAGVDLLKKVSPSSFLSVPWMCEELPYSCQ